MYCPPVVPTWTIHLFSGWSDTCSTVISICIVHLYGPPVLLTTTAHLDCMFERHLLTFRSHHPHNAGLALPKHHRVNSSKQLAKMGLNHRRGGRLAKNFEQVVIACSGMW